MHPPMLDHRQHLDGESLRVPKICVGRIEQSDLLRHREEPPVHQCRYNGRGFTTCITQRLGFSTR